MNSPEAVSYAARVLAGQSDVVEPVERMRRVKRALDGQGLTLDNPREFYGPAFESWTLQIALAAFNQGGTLQERVERVRKVSEGFGSNLQGVLKATKGYLKLKTRKARKARLHS